MNEETNNEQVEEITLHTFMEQFTASGGTIVDLIEYLKIDDKPTFDVAALELLWDWITIDSLELLEFEYDAHPETRKLLKRIAKDIALILESEGGLC